MRPSALSLLLVGLIALGCAGSGQAARKKACTTACDKVHTECKKQCPTGTGKATCVKACTKARTNCLDTCNTHISS